ncbi:proline--tRNA ligase [bacterium]|nr:proline--tRNA ligase [bacterium]
MIWSKVKSLIPTLKEQPAEAEIVSHILMIRAGLIRKLSAGLYSYLPLCLKVIRNVEKIIREEMNAKNAQELLMPLLQPGEVWERSGRWHAMGKEMVRIKNRQERDFVLGPTHEEVITDLVSREISSYRDLPCNFYQIQAKVRDEIRPRFGVIRAKEFIMKDAYSFHADEESLNETFNDMYDAYTKIFQRCGIKVMSVEADTGMMGGSASIEFMALADSGEDLIASCSCGYAANLEKAQSIKEEIKFDENPEKIKEVDTPNARTIEEVSAFLKVEPYRMIKTLFYQVDEKPVCVLVRGDDSVNEVKLKNYLKAVELFLLDDETIEKITGAPVGFAGPVGLKNIRIIADKNVMDIVNGVTGANKKDKHIINVNLKQDANIKEIIDLVLVKQGEICPKCKKDKLSITSGIELGHIFKLGKKYTLALGANFLDKSGKQQPMIMGCYGIGVSRMVAAIIEQNYDENGIIWPASVAPFDAQVLALNTNDEAVMKKSMEIYEFLKSAHSLDVLLDDRDIRPGVKFKDADLIGIPIRIVVSSKGLEKGTVEIKIRRTGEIVEAPAVLDEKFGKDILWNSKK